MSQPWEKRGFTLQEEKGLVNSNFANPQTGRFTKTYTSQIVSIPNSRIWRLKSSTTETWYILFRHRPVLELHHPRETCGRQTSGRHNMSGSSPVHRRNIPTTTPRVQHVFPNNSEERGGDMTLPSVPVGVQWVLAGCYLAPVQTAKEGRPLASSLTFTAMIEGPFLFPRTLVLHWCNSIYFWRDTSVLHRHKCKTEERTFRLLRPNSAFCYTI